MAEIPLSARYSLDELELLLDSERMLRSASELRSKAPTGNSRYETLPQPTERELEDLERISAEAGRRQAMPGQALLDFPYDWARTTPETKARIREGKLLDLE